jgi:hypothetical protein
MAAITAAESAAQSYVGTPIQSYDWGSRDVATNRGDLESAHERDAQTGGNEAGELAAAKSATADPLTPNYAATLGELSPGAPIPAWGTGYGYLPVGFSEGKCLGDAQSMGSFSWDGHAQA